MTDVKDDRERYVLGHKPLDVHADFYVEHPVGKLKPIIDRIDPMNTPVEPVKEAA